MTRLDAFETKTLPKWLMKVGASEHFRENAMEHLHWMALFIDEHKDLVRAGELFYEQGTEKRGSTLDRDRNERRSELRQQRLFGRCRGIRPVDEYDRIHQVCTCLNIRPSPVPPSTNAKRETGDNRLH